MKVAWTRNLAPSNTEYDDRSVVGVRCDGGVAIGELLGTMFVGRTDSGFRAQEKRETGKAGAVP